MSNPKTIPVAIIGPGNIGTDLLFKARRSAWLSPVWSVGVVEASEGLRIAREQGVQTTFQGLDSVIDKIAEDGVKIAFDATSAKYHRAHSEALAARGIRVIDLTPAAIGPYSQAIRFGEQALTADHDTAMTRWVAEIKEDVRHRSSHS